MKLKKGEKKPPVTAETPLTPREIQFLDAFFMSEPPFNGAEAARVVGYSSKCAKFQAVRMLTKVNLKAEIERRHLAIAAAAELTMEQWLKKGVDEFYHGSIKKMFDEHNNVLDIPLMHDREVAMIEGFEIVEDFTKVRNANGTEAAVPTGYTKKFKLTPPIKRHEYIGKICGFITDKPLPVDPSLKSLTVVFVNAQGKPVDVNFNPHTRQISRVDEKPRHAPGVTFVGHRG
mgnify:CR=1 FL=1